MAGMGRIAAAAMGKRVSSKKKSPLGSVATAATKRAGAGGARGKMVSAYSKPTRAKPASDRKMSDKKKRPLARKAAKRAKRAGVRGIRKRLRGF